MVQSTQKSIPSPPPGKRAFTLADGSQIWMPAHFVVELLPSVGDSVSVYSVRAGPLLWVDSRQVPTRGENTPHRAMPSEPPTRDAQ